MGREIHRARVGKKVRYGILSTVTMSYVSPFGTRKEIIAALKREGFKPEAIKRMFSQKTDVKVNTAKQTVSFPVYRIDTNQLEKWRV